MKNGLTQPQLPVKDASTVDSRFLADMQDLFAKRRVAHIGNYRYSQPNYEHDIVNGLAIWNRISERAKQGGKYYIFSDEVEMIAQNFPEIESLLPDELVLVDLGPGSKEAITDKIGSVIGTLRGKIVEYIAVDLVPDILTNAEAVFTNKFPSIKFSEIQGDMFEPLSLPAEKPRLSVVFGQTLFNVDINPHSGEEAKSRIVKMLSGLRHNLRPEDKLVIPQNCSEKLDELMDAYWEQKEIWENLMHRVKRDLLNPDVSGSDIGTFSPEAFEFEPYWVNSAQIMSHTLVAKEFMQFTLGGEPFSIRKGERFYCHNTAIYPASTFEHMTKKAGLKTFYQAVNPKGRMALHGLEL